MKSRVLMAASLCAAMVFYAHSALAEGEKKVPGSASDLASALMKEKLARANAREATPAQPSAAPSAPLGAAMNMGALAVVVAGLLFGATFYIRRKKEGDDLSASATMKVVESLWLGRGQRLMLVSVRGQKVLIGSSGGTLQNLATLPTPQTSLAPSAASAQLAAQPKVAKAPEPEKRSTDDPDTKVEERKLEFADMVKSELEDQVDRSDRTDRPDRSDRPDRLERADRRTKRSPVRSNRNRILRQLNSL